MAQLRSVASKGGGLISRRARSEDSIKSKIRATRGWRQGIVLGTKMACAWAFEGLAGGKDQYGFMHCRGGSCVDIVPVPSDSMICFVLRSTALLGSGVLCLDQHW